MTNQNTQVKEKIQGLKKTKSTFRATLESLECNDSQKKETKSIVDKYVTLKSITSTFLVFQGW